MDMVLDTAEDMPRPLTLLEDTLQFTEEVATFKRTQHPVTRASPDARFTRMQPAITRALRDGHFTARAATGEVSGDTRTMVIPVSVTMAAMVIRTTDTATMVTTPVGAMILTTVTLPADRIRIETVPT